MFANVKFRKNSDIVTLFSLCTRNWYWLHVELLSLISSLYFIYSIWRRKIWWVSRGWESSQWWNVVNLIYWNMKHILYYRVIYKYLQHFVSLKVIYLITIFCKILLRSHQHLYVYLPVRVHWLLHTLNFFSDLTR